MKLFLALCALVSLASTASLAQEATGLVINAAEIGVGKFHREDNRHHKYAANNVWAASIMPESAALVSPVVFQTSDNEVSVEFSTLDELLHTVMAIAKQKQKKIAVLNINGHGLPGGMWFPKDEATRQSPDCKKWNVAAQAPDKANYDQYYEAVKLTDIMSLRLASYLPGKYPCVTDASGWKDVVSKIPDIKSYFTEDAQAHFESCLVGLGPVGKAFTQTVGALLFSGSHSMVKAITNFGLGDWSMPEGMGFWDYFTLAQLKHDNEVYPKNRTDREIMKKGIIRVTYLENGKWASKLVADQDFMYVGYTAPGQNMFSNPVRLVPEPTKESSGLTNMILAPLSIHLPGTDVELQRMN